MGIERQGPHSVGAEDDKVPQATSSLGFISDVTLEVRVEFGRTSLSIGELLKLKRGSVIALDREKDAGMDVVVNGNKVGAGEVVVVNENYGIRVTSIKEPQFFEG